MVQLHKYQPDHVAPPGALLQDYLSAQEISGRELARRCGRSPKLISEILAGKAPVEPETAIQLERVLEAPAALWLNMEANYRLHLARVHEEKELSAHIGWARTFPLSELAKRDFLQAEKKPGQQVRELLAFFGCGSVEACKDRFNELSVVAFRHSPTFSSHEGALLAWLRIGDLKAEKIETEDFDRTAFLTALKDIRALTTKPLDVDQITRLCANAGVVFVLEKALPNVALSGVSRWLSPRRALIQQTMRHLSDDHFWFTFFHECAHLVLHSRKAIFLDGKGVSNSQAKIEEEANEWASDFLVPSASLRRFITRFSFRPKEIREFALEQGIAPGIVVGQLQYMKVLEYSQMNELKTRYAWID